MTTWKEFTVRTLAAMGASIVATFLLAKFLPEYRGAEFFAGATCASVYLLTLYWTKPS